MVRISLTGIILKGRYCILEQIGQGGEGSLYLARDLELGTMWAVKELPISKKREAKLLRLLEHPSLPRMIDYAEKDGYCYIIMEYIKGQSLEEERKGKKSFALRDILEIGSALCDVLKYLHAQKPPIYYGDLKPGNIMRTAQGRLYLVDLGSAVFGYGDRVQNCLGTKGYAAPEQYEGKIGPESDIYALGKTLWVLCGKKVFWYMAGTPSFARLLGKCVQKNRKLRYRDMDQVKENLVKAAKKENGRKTAGILLAGIFGCALSIFLLSIPEKKTDFEEQLSQITELYYVPAFLEGEKEERAEICSKAEEGLTKLLAEYPDGESQRKLLLLLALNGELQGKRELATFYFEQLKTAHSGFRETYGEYGVYLYRANEMEKCQDLWREYQQKDEQGLLSGTETPNTKAWSALMDTQKIAEENFADPLL